MNAQPAPVLTPEHSKKIAEFQARIPAAVKAAEDIKVTDDRTEQLAVNARAILKERYADAEKERTADVAPHNSYVKHVNGLYKPLTDMIDKAVAYVDGQLLAWRRTKQERINAENQRREQEAERARQEAARKAEEEAKAAGNFTPAEAAEYAQGAAAEVTAPIPVAPPPKIVRTDFAAAGMVTTLDFELLDIAALAVVLPAALELKRKVILDHGRAAEKAGKKPEDIGLAGVRFFRREGIQER